MREQDFQSALLPVCFGEGPHKPGKVSHWATYTATHYRLPGGGPSRRARPLWIKLLGLLEPFMKRMKDPAQIEKLRAENERLTRELEDYRVCCDEPEMTAKAYISCHASLKDKIAEIDNLRAELAEARRALRSCERELFTYQEATDE